MPCLIFIQADGTRVLVEALPGDTVMRVARTNCIVGVIGECGGCATCMTCHCYVDPDRINELPSPGEVESILLTVLTEAKPNSRLTCQIVVRQEMDQMTFTVPDWQG